MEDDAFVEGNPSGIVWPNSQSSEGCLCARVTLQELTVQDKGRKGQVAMIALGSFSVEKSRMHLTYLESKIEVVWKHMRKRTRHKTQSWLICSLHAWMTR